MFRIMLALAIPAALVACQGATDALAPDTGVDPSSPATSGAPSSEPVASFVVDRIAFTGHLADGSDIFTVGSLGGTPKHLTSFPGMETDPAWSSDGKQIAFMRDRNGAPDVFLMNADGTNKRWARFTPTQHVVATPSWSPDGTHLLVAVNYLGVSYIAKLDLATGNLAFIAPQGVMAVQGYQPIYDPTGTSIYYLDRTLKTIKRFTPGGAQSTVLAAGVFLSDLAISPDGSRLAYGAAVGNQSEIHVLSLATNLAKRLTYSPGHDTSPTWSPDGFKLAFHSGRTGTAQIYTMSSWTGGSLTQITNRTYGASSPAWLR
jgi:TolB protein